MALGITVREVGGVSVLDLAGRLAPSGESKELKDQINQLLAEKKTKLLLNLAHVDHVDSSGVGLLVRCLTTARAAGGDLKLENPTKEVKKIVEATNLAQILDLYEDESKAVASYS